MTGSAKVSGLPAARPCRRKKVITTAGGFEANLDWLAEGWGEAAKNFLVRGTPWNTGTVLKSLLDQGVKPVGALDQCHAVAIDARAPKYDGGIASRIGRGAVRHRPEP